MKITFASLLVVMAIIKFVQGKTFDCVGRQQDAVVKSEWQ